MDRRDFLLKSATLLAGSLCGLTGFSKAFASEGTFYPPRIALIIDDIGYSLSRARQFLDLRVPMTFSILPWLSHSRDLAIEIHDKGYEIMLHQPMEPYRPDLDPGPGALYVGDEAEKISRIIDENILAVPFASGVNNHMGSKFTESRKEIGEALSVIGKNNLFFVDSVTSNRSKAYKTAKFLHMSAASRNIFLDNVPKESAILLQLRKLMRHARKYGRAIGIGHPHPETARAIAQLSQGLEDSEISLIHVSRLLTP